MISDLQRLLNTLCMVETKGESTKIMADCIRFVEKMINDENTTDASMKEGV